MTGSCPGNSSSSPGGSSSTSSTAKNGKPTTTNGGQAFLRECALSLLNRAPGLLISINSWRYLVLEMASLDSQRLSIIDHRSSLDLSGSPFFSYDTCIRPSNLRTPTIICHCNLSLIVDGLVYFDQVSVLPTTHLFVNLGTFIPLGGASAASLQADRSGGDVIHFGRAV